METPQSLSQVKELLLSNADLDPECFRLSLPNYHIAVHCNDQVVASGLQQYFMPFVEEAEGDVTPDITVYVVESDKQPLKADWIEWSRETGKTGRKELYFELPGIEPKEHARIIKKARTGMLFVQSLNTHIAFGPCLKNINQIINFINNQFMNHLQMNDWLICHAAAAHRNGVGVAFAGFSGGGKSTTMLHLLNETGYRYVTNDRLFIKPENGVVMAQGVPKLPRVNPGTLLNNPSLSAILSDEEKQKLLKLPKDELWQLEQKYDVDVATIFGDQQSLWPHQLSHLMILNWHRNNADNTEISEVELDKKVSLLDAVMKSKGPFYQYPDGQFYQDATELNPKQYLSTLENVTVWEVTGKVDFDKVVRHCCEIIAVK